MSRILLDTHALLWTLFAPERLSDTARAAILDPGHDVLVSIASAWEIAIKQNTGKLALPDMLDAAVESSGFRFLSITPTHCRVYAALPLRQDHRDPFDRMLIAQAHEEGCVLLSRNGRLDPYGVERIW